MPLRCPSLSRLRLSRFERCYRSLGHGDIGDIQPASREHALDPHAAVPFADKATLTLHAGAGGHGCASFLREKYIAEGPPNGGDGGTGGGIYLQAVRGETSLHKLARRREIRAGRGKNGQGRLRRGEQGDDVLLTVPVGTVVRELWRHDPVEEEQERIKRERASHRGQAAAGQQAQRQQLHAEKWLLFPGAPPSLLTHTDMPSPPGPRRSAVAHSAPASPICMDLDEPMERPMLLLAGAVGGLGNPHFASRTLPRPQFATRGLEATSVGVSLELKLLADVGLVGLPNAGKSTLIRALTNSRARTGSWPFTTIQPNMGTVVLDDHVGRPRLARIHGVSSRQNFTIADIPGLVQDAHLDRGLGLSFLRHVERAAVLAFVVDLGADDPVSTLESLWHEIGQYDALRSLAPGHESRPMSTKQWFVVAAKADLEGSQDKFNALHSYLMSVSEGAVEHPSGAKNTSRQIIELLPVSAIHGSAGGTDRIKDLVAGLLEHRLHSPPTRPEAV